MSQVFSEFPITEAGPSQINVPDMEGIPQKCAGLMKNLRTWRGVLLLLLVSKGTHHAMLTTPRKSRRCDAGKTKKNISLSSLVFIGVAFLLSLVPKSMKAMKQHEDKYLTATGALGIILWIASSFFE